MEKSSRSFQIAADQAMDLAERLLQMGTKGKMNLQKAIIETTVLTSEAIADKITSDIEPHSGMSRTRNPQPEVTDLVDTGHYRASWQTSYPHPYSGKVATNSEYALALEFGFDGTVTVKEHDRTYKKGPKAGTTEHVSSYEAERHSIPFYVARDTARQMAPIFIDKLNKAVWNSLK